MGVEGARKWWPLASVERQKVSFDRKTHSHDFLGN